MKGCKMTGAEKRREVIKKIIAEYTAEITVDRKTARAALMKTGIYTRSGELTPEYGGPERKKTKKATNKAA
jgi:hypothetical protein